MSRKVGLLTLFLGLSLGWSGLAPAGEEAGSAAADSTEAAADSVPMSDLDRLLAAREDSTLAAAVDSAAVATADSTAAEESEIPLTGGSVGVASKFTSDLSAQERFLTNNNNMSLSIAWPNTWTLGASVKYDRTEPREYGRDITTSSTGIDTGMKLWGALPVTLGVSNRYTDVVNTTANNTRTDYTETSGVNMTISGARELNSWLSVNGSSNLGASTRDYRNSSGVSNSDETGMRILTGYVDIKPAADLTISSGIKSDVKFANQELLTRSADVETRTDSMQVSIDYKRGTKLTLGLSGGQRNNDVEMLDFVRNQYGTVEDSSRIAVEVSTTDDWGMDGNLSWNSGSLFKISTRGNVRSHRKRVANRDDLSKDTDSYMVGLSTEVKPWKSSAVTVNYEVTNNQTLDANADSRKYNRKMHVSGDQKLGDTFTLSVVGSFLLGQDFYTDKVRNPQDRDHAQTTYSVSVDGVVTPWLSAGNEIKWFENRDIFIDSSRSSSNKDKRTLTWKGRLKYNFFRKYQVTQQCQVSAIEDDFVFTSDKNALDKEVTLFTQTTFPIVRSVKLFFDHEFRLRQMGGYRPDSTVAGYPKTFFRESRKKTEKLTLRVDYNVKSYLTVSCEEELGREIDYDYVDGSSKTKLSGELNFQIAFNKKLGKSGQIDAGLKHRARFGPFVTENQRSLWFPSLKISYTF